MGNAQSTVSNRLITLVKNGGIWDELISGAQTNFTVDMSVQSVGGEGRFYSPEREFEVSITGEIPKDALMIFVFPGNPPKCVWTTSFSTPEPLAKVCDDNMPRAKGGFQFGICWRDSIFRFSGVTGRIYLIWTDEVSVYEDGERDADKKGAIPLIVNTDSHYGIQSVYPLVCGTHDSAARLIRETQIRFLNRGTHKFLGIDTPPKAPPVSGVSLLSEEEARFLKERLARSEKEAGMSSGTDFELGQMTVDDEVASFLSSGGGVGEENTAGGSTDCSEESFVREKVSSMMIANNFANDLTIQQNGMDLGVPTTPPSYERGRMTQQHSERMRMPSTLMGRENHRTVTARIGIKPPSKGHRHRHSQSKKHGASEKSEEYSTGSDVVPSSGETTPHERPVNPPSPSQVPKLPIQ